MRYITKTGSAKLINPMTDEETDATVTFDNLVRALFVDPRVFKTIDVYAASDARASLLKAKVGETVGVTEAVWEMLKGLILPKPGEDCGISPAMAYSAPEMLRAITDAGTKPSADGQAAAPAAQVAE